MNWDKIEQIAKTWEKYHNMFYLPISVGLFVVLSATIMANVTIFGAAIQYFEINLVDSGPYTESDIDLIWRLWQINPLVLFLLLYVMLCTRFKFPIEFKDDGSGGRKIKVVWK